MRVLLAYARVRACVCARVRACACVPNLVSSNAAINACEKGMQWEAALGLVLEMCLRLLMPIVMRRSATIGACDKGKHWEEALGLMREMGRRLLTPDVMSYNATINTCEKGIQREAMQEFAAIVANVIEAFRAHADACTFPPSAGFCAIQSEVLCTGR